MHQHTIFVDVMALILDIMLSDGFAVPRIFTLRMKQLHQSKTDRRFSAIPQSCANVDRFQYKSFRNRSLFPAFDQWLYHKYTEDLLNVNFNFHSDIIFVIVPDHEPYCFTVRFTGILVKEVQH